MTTIFIIHGSYGNPEENWFPWLRKELENFGCKVFVPKFPTPENQSLDSWLKVFEKYKQYINENAILVGHSIAPAFILHILEKHKIKAVFLVAGFIELLGNEEVDEINSTFFEKPFNWDRIKNKCKHFYIYISDNDPYVPLEVGKKMSDKLGVKPIIVKGAGHFNKAAGYTKFPLLLEGVKKEL